VIKDEEVEAEEENNSGYHGYNNVKEWGVVGVVGVLPHWLLIGCVLEQKTHSNKMKNKKYHTNILLHGY
jgi:hypothetical protein